MKSAWFSMITVPNFNSNKGHLDFDMWKSNTFPWRPVTPRGGFLLFSLSPGLRQDVDASAVRLHRRRVLFFGDLRGWESSRFQVAILRLEFADTDMEVATHYPLVFGFWWIAISQKSELLQLKPRLISYKTPAAGSLWISDLCEKYHVSQARRNAFFKIHLEQLA